MKAFLDTSVLVPVFYGDHVHHARSLDLFTRFEKTDVSCGAHSLVEVYSSLTRMPGKYRVAPEQAILFIGDIEDRFTVFGLSSGEYFKMLSSYAALGIAGGAIYDALLSSCALKAAAQRIYTWNIRHYERFGPEIAKLLATP